MDLTRQPQAWEHTLGLGVETAAGIWVAPSMWVPGTSSIKRTAGWEVIELPVGEADETHTGQRGIEVAGSLKAAVCPGRCQWIVDLLSLLNPTHYKSLSILEQHNGEFAKGHTGCTANQVTLRCDLNGDAEANIDVVGHWSDEATPGSPNYVGQPSPFHGINVNVYIDGVRLIGWNSVELQFSHNLNTGKWAGYTYGGVDYLLRRDLPRGRRSLMVNLEIDWESKAWYQKYKAGTVFQAVVDFRRASNYLTVTYPTCVIQDGADPEQQDGDQGVTLGPRIKPLKVVGGVLYTAVTG